MLTTCPEEWSGSHSPGTFPSRKAIRPRYVHPGSLQLVGKHTLPWRGCPGLVPHTLRPRSLRDPLCSNNLKQVTLPSLGPILGKKNQHIPELSKSFELQVHIQGSQFCLFSALKRPPWAQLRLHAARISLKAAPSSEAAVQASEQGLGIGVVGWQLTACSVEPGANSDPGANGASGGAQRPAGHPCKRLSPQHPRTGETRSGTGQSRQGRASSTGHTCVRPASVSQSCQPGAPALKGLGSATFSSSPVARTIQGRRGSPCPPPVALVSHLLHVLVLHPSWA